MEVDPSVKAAAARLQEAYEKLQKDQDPLVKKADREIVIQVLTEATAVTQQAELREATKSAYNPIRSTN